MAIGAPDGANKTDHWTGQTYQKESHGVDENFTLFISDNKLHLSISEKVSSVAIYYASSPRGFRAPI